MIYDGTVTSEMIKYYIDDEVRNGASIEMAKFPKDSVFSVEHNRNKNWCYCFDMTNPSDYERVKFSIMKEILECEDTEELLDNLSECFEEEFSDVLIGKINYH